MTNMSYVISSALVMLLWITNLSVSMTSFAQVELCFDLIQFLNWNVQLLIRIQSHLILFQHCPLQEANTDKSGL